MSALVFSPLCLNGRTHEQNCKSLSSCIQLNICFYTRGLKRMILKKNKSLVAKEKYLREISIFQEIFFFTSLADPPVKMAKQCQKKIFLHFRTFQSYQLFSPKTYIFFVDKGLSSPPPWRTCLLKMYVFLGGSPFERPPFGKKKYRKKNQKIKMLDGTVWYVL